MSRHERYYQPRTFSTCACGSTDAYWHGPEEGLREFVCDRCYEHQQKTSSAAVEVAK